MEFNRIVVGLELGHLSDQAIHRAMSLAREFGAQLDVVHGTGIEAARFGAGAQAFFLSFAEEAQARAREGARGKLALLVEDPVYAAKPLDEYLHVSPSGAAQALVEYAKEQRADVIVLGPHRHRLLDFGGTSREVLARSPCPVWIEPAEAVRFERVVAPIDLSPFTPLVLEWARCMAARFTVPVRVLHVFQPPRFEADSLRGTTLDVQSTLDGLRKGEQTQVRELVQRFDWGPLPVEAEFAEGEPAHEIAERTGPTDLIVMGTHGHRGLVRAVLGSCAYRVLRHAKGPILVVPQSAEAQAAAGSS